MMKKIITLATVAFSLFAFNAKAQLPDGSIAPNFTLTDLNSNSWDLYTVLNSGKTVYIDFSATWCGPCWSLHNRRSLDTLYEKHGPTGQPGVSATTTNDVMVFFIESDDGTNTGCLSNSGCNTSYAPTQGNWVTGTSFPIMDNGQNTATAFGVPYYPSVFMICPDKGTHFLQTTEITASTFLSALDLYNLRNTTPCLVATSSLDASVSNTIIQSLISTCDSMNPTITLTNESTVPLTSATITYKVNGVTQKTYNWTGSLATYASIAITNVKLFGAIGTSTITATVSNPNGGTDANAANDITSYLISNVVMTPNTVPTVAEGFQGTTFPPTNWGNVNGGDQTYMWTTANVGGNQASSKCAFIDLWDTPDGDIDELVLQTLDLSSATTASMSFDIAKAGIVGQYDRLKVKVSTDCAKTWTTVYSKIDHGFTSAPQDSLNTVISNNAWTPNAAANWRNDVINLNAYAGMSAVLIKFQTISAYSNNLYIDNINLSASNSIKVINNIANVSLYPNPTSSQAAIEISLASQDNVTITIYNNMGQLVLSQQHNQTAAGDNTFNLNTENLSNGIYNVVVNTNKGFITQKLVVSK